MLANLFSIKIIVYNLTFALCDFFSTASVTKMETEARQTIRLRIGGVPLSTRLLLHQNLKYLILGRSPSGEGYHSLDLFELSSGSSVFQLYFGNLSCSAKQMRKRCKKLGLDSLGQKPGPEVREERPCVSYLGRAAKRGVVKTSHHAVAVVSRLLPTLSEHEWRCGNVSFGLK